MKQNGTLHPISQIMNKSLNFFSEKGFQIYFGNEIVSEWENFDALNVPKHHPARDMQDTFWVKSNKPTVLRAHTTGSEVEIVKKNNLKPPFKIVIPGRCFRNERTDSTHEHTFYQIDGIAVSENMNMTYLVGILDEWMKDLFGENIKTRIRPSLFSFVEPGIEMDVKLSDGKWREMLGAGMAHPVVLKNMNIDPEKFKGIMWGAGIDRYTMQKFAINEMRLFHSKDLRFLKQFGPQIFNHR